jgi:hypothetical protein
VASQFRGVTQNIKQSDERYPNLPVLSELQKWVESKSYSREPFDEYLKGLFDDLDKVNPDWLESTTRGSEMSELKRAVEEAIKKNTPCESDEVSCIVS